MPLPKRNPLHVDSNPREAVQITRHSRLTHISANGPGHVKFLVELAQNYSLPENLCNEEVLRPLYELDASGKEKPAEEVRQSDITNKHNIAGSPRVDEIYQSDETEYTTKDNIKLHAIIFDPLLYRGTGNESDTRLYARLDLLEGTVTKLTKKREDSKTGARYYSHNSKRLRSYLKRKGLSTVGDVEELQKRAIGFDDREDNKWFEMMIAKRDLTKLELELVVGHPVLAVDWNISQGGISRAKLEVMGYLSLSTGPNLAIDVYYKLYQQELKVIEAVEHQYKQSTDILPA